MTRDPVLLALADRRRNAERLIRRGTAIVDRGKSELAECDRFEQFYSDAKATPASMAPDPDESFFADPGKVTIVARGATENDLIEAMREQFTLKQAIVNVLKSHPEGLESGDLLQALRDGPWPNLLRTSMSPQLSRMKGKEVANVQGRWTLAENIKAASLL